MINLINWLIERQRLAIQLQCLGHEAAWWESNERRRTKLERAIRGY